MVGIMAAISRDKVTSRINLIKRSGGDVASRLDQLRRLRDELWAVDSAMLEEFMPSILGLLTDLSSPVRRFVALIVGEIGMKHLELLTEIIPALVDILKDDSPAVARQAIACGVDVLRCFMVKVAVQGFYSNEFNESLKLSWACLLKFRDEVLSMAFKVGSDGRKLSALKFVESVVLLYTPDPNGLSEPPSDQTSEEKFEEFNVSWLRGGNPVLNVRDLSAEASRSLGLLLDQLRFPSFKSHNYLVIIVLIKSLSTIARKRPAFYGRILPVLLGLDPSSSAIKGMHLAGVYHALKNAFESCLNCTHPGAAPWRDRLINKLNELLIGKTTEQPANEIGKNNVKIERTGDSLGPQIHEDEKPSTELTPEHNSASRKRSGVPESASEGTDDDMSAKRARSTPEKLEEPGLDTSGNQDSFSSSAPTLSRSDTDNGPVQQLVAMFAALAAQGEKAAASLDILVSSISADLLAEVVMTNIWNLPPKTPTSKEDEEPLGNMVSHADVTGNDSHIKQLSVLLTSILPQSSSALVNETEIIDPHLAVSSEVEHAEGEEPRVTLADDDNAYDDDLDNDCQKAIASVNESVSPEGISSAMESGFAGIPYQTSDIEGMPSEIPGLGLPTQEVGLLEDAAIFSKASSDSGDVKLTVLYDSNNEKLTNLQGIPMELDTTSVELDRAPVEVSLSTDRSEELSPKASVSQDTNTFSSSTATSVRVSSQLVLPKMSAPVVNLADGSKDQLQQLAFARIINAYKQVTVAGGSQVRFSILAHSGLQFPSDLDPWKLLKEHILSDYVNTEGHELTLQILYRLFGEAEEERDFFTSTTATSVYETFLLQVAETLRDSFPASDKSLSRLLGEVPYLPKSVFELLECLCSPGSSKNDDKELHGGDRVTQGLSTVWSLILLRPPIRDTCLKIALKSAGHPLDEVRMKAIRLVANKLYPLPVLSGKIEEFAKEMLLSVSSDGENAMKREGEETEVEGQKDGNLSTGIQPLSSSTLNVSPDSQQLSASESTSSSTVAEMQRCMSLYFALCTKRHSLFRQIFYAYKSASNVAKQAVHHQIPLLVRTIGSSHDLLDIISDPPAGSEGLVTQVVHTLTDGTVPSPELVSTIQRLYNTKLKDIDILIPILPFLPRDEVLILFPHLVNSPMDKFQVMLSRVLQGSNHSTPVLMPAEALIAIHGIDPDRDGIPLKKVTDACNACFEQRQIFTQQVLAKVLNQLVEQIPLPMLFMRTVLQAIGAFPSLVEFIMEILSRLISKQIWKYPKLWVGFMKCVLLTKPQSFGVLLQLPSAQLENALNRTPALKAPLIAHASQPQIKLSLPRSTLVVLGLVSEPQESTQSQPTQTQTQTPTSETEMAASEKEAETEKSKEVQTTG